MTSIFLSRIARSIIFLMTRTLQKKMKKEVNTDLKTLYNWLLANKISLNCSKTEIIFFHKMREKTPDIKIKMNGHIIYTSTNIK